MKRITIDFSHSDGKMKPMHAVNNGPVGSGRSDRSNAALFENARIPYMRNHDSAFHTAYGGEFAVDVHRIFPDFSASATCADSYHFEATDKYVATCQATGGNVFYRLGASIEHGVKKGTFPPPDFQKWAVICEHIIRHYTEGWADGFFYPIEYWEIWNEPDCQNKDGSNPCWQGTWEEFESLYVTTLAHLKRTFPRLKIGGPAHVSLGAKRIGGVISLLKKVKEAGLCPDFFSFHRYADDPKAYREYGLRAKALLDEVGIETELILDEWNYVEGWTGEGYDASVRAIKSLKGAAFVAASFCTAQDSPLDMMMYYDARPCPWCGMFDTDFYTPLKGYYPFLAFGHLYEMGRFVKPLYEEDPLYACAAAGESACGAILCHFQKENAGAETIKLSLAGLAGKHTLTLSLLDEENDLTPVRTLPIEGDTLELELTLPLFTTYYLEAR